MVDVRLSFSNTINALGADVRSVFQALSEGRTGLQQMDGWQRLRMPLCFSRIEDDLLQDCFQAAEGGPGKTRLEQLMIASLHDVVQRSGVKLDARTGLIIATTKGNIDALAKASQFPAERAELAELGKQVASHFGIPNTPVILSNACVSGLLALVVARRFIENGTYDHVLVTTGDLLSEFVLSGFNAFQALSAEPCRPYCVRRGGINLGEAVASALVTRDATFFSEDNVRIVGSGSCNDANHISGPSRTGEGLFRSISLAMQEADVTPDDLQLISAHGTATVFNDEMESIAFKRSGLSHVPLHSLKGYFGHCLGAAGLLETLIAAQCLYQGRTIASAGFAELGVSQPLNVIIRSGDADMRRFIKTASGFGGCNTAVVFERAEA